MALFEIEQEVGAPDNKPEKRTFKDFAAADICLAFFNSDEHAEYHTVDGKKALVIVEDQELREHSAHWEAGAKQNFDTGLYTAYTVLYIKVCDYGPKPKVGKHLTMDAGTDHQRTYSIQTCQEESGVYRMTMARTRQ